MAYKAIDVDGMSAADLARRLDRDGVVRLRGVLSSEWLEAARVSVREYIAGHGESDFFVASPGDEIDNPAHELVSDPELRALFDGVTSARWPKYRATCHIQSGLPVRAGWGRRGSQSLFHYDASILTMLVPIFIPKAGLGESGELVAFPNKRPFRRFLVSHVIDKALTHNSLYRHRITRKVFREPERHIVDLNPGDAYVFWGYRTFHGNLPCAPGLLRVALVLHFGEVHRPSWALTMARAFSAGRRTIRRWQWTPPTPQRP